MVVPKAATDIYWPVTSIIGVLDCDELPPDLCQRVTEDVEARHYAFVSTAEALRANIPTLAAKHPFNINSQVHPRKA